MHLIQKNRNRKKNLIILSILIMVFFGVGAYVTRDLWQKKDEVKRDGNNVSLEKNDIEKAKEKEIRSNPDKKTTNDQTDVPETPNINNETKKYNVNVVLTSAYIKDGIVKASGFVSDVVESGGICSYIFSSGDKTITKQSKTYENPTSTTCATVSFPSTELSSGSWSVSLSYSSDSSEGTSANKIDLTTE